MSADMNAENVEDVFQEVADLARETGAVGAPEIERFARKQKTNKLQEVLDYLRVCIKYQEFDLEATRRENEFLKKENKQLEIRLSAIGG